MKRLVLILLALLAMNAQADGCLWYAERQDLKNPTGVTVPLKEVRDIAATTDCGVWALQNDRLYRFKADGSQDLQIDLGHHGRILLADPYDGSVWVASEHRLWHLDAQGKLLQDPGISPKGRGERERGDGPENGNGRTRALTLAPDQSLWVLDGQRLTRIGQNGAPLDTWDTRFRGEAKGLLVDGLGSRYWLAGEKRLIAFDASTRAQLIERRLDKDIEALALDPLTGTVWVLTDKSLVAYTRDGTQTQRILLRTLKIEDPEDIAYDPLNHEVLVAHDKGIARFSDSGTLKGTTPGHDISAVAVPDFGLLPKLSLTTPPQDALTNNPKLPFALQYGAGCLTPDCDPGDAYFKALVLDAQLDTQALGKSFVFDKTTRKATYTPGSPLTDGTHAFRAQVKDLFGHVSGTVTGQITVDTFPPKFLSLAPADGSTFYDPNITLLGSVDDTAAALTLEGLGSLLTQILNNTLNFSRNLILSPGPNSLTVTAVDKAGNAASVRVTYTYVPVKVTLTAPTDGARIDDDLVTLSGTWQGPAGTTLALNGKALPLNANQFQYADLPLKPGANPITVTATAPQGYTASQTVTVTSTNTGPSLVTWQPAIPQAGSYTVYAKWVATQSNATTATYTVVHADGATPVIVNQQQNGGQWNSLGTFAFAPNQNHHITLTDVADGVVIADAVKLTQATSQQGAEETYYIHPDQLGTPRLIADQNQNPVWKWENDEAFGANQPNEDPGNTNAKFVFNLRYPGQYFDQETNTNYNYFRDYDFTIGRYIESDPIGLQGGLNTYSYSDGNPISKIDLLGLETYQCIRPLGGKPGEYLAYDNVTHHQYSCVKLADGKLVCGGQAPSGSIVSSPGRPTTPKEDYYHPDTCKKTQPDNQCFEQCLQDEWNKPRPNYSVIFGLGTHCQEYDDDVNLRCRRKCGLK
jgi:RHS repeat-associated protein